MMPIATDLSVGKFLKRVGAFERATWGETAALLAAAVAYLVWVAGVPAHSALAATAILATLCYLPVLAIAHRVARPPTITEALLYTSLGLVLLASFSLISMAMGASREAAIVPVVLLGLAGLIARRGNVLPRLGRSSFAGPLDRALSYAAVALFLGQPLYSYLLMGRGEFPAVFINVDAPFYLGQVHSLLRSAGWPPDSLDVAGVATTYHYGVQEAAALLSDWAAVQPHVALFTLNCGLYLLTTGLVLLSLAQRLRGDLPAALLLGLAIVFAFRRFVPGAADIPHPAGVFSLMAVIVAVMALLDEHALRRATLLGVVVVTFVCARVPNFLALEVGLGLWAAGAVLLKRSWRPMRDAVAITASAGAVLLALDYASGSGGLSLSFGWQLSDWSNRYFNGLAEAIAVSEASAAWRIWGRFLANQNLIFAATLLGVLMVGWNGSRIHWRLLAFAAAPLVLLNVTIYTNESFGTANGQTQVDLTAALAGSLHETRFYWWGVLAFYLGAVRLETPRALQRAAAAGLILVIAVPVVTGIVQSVGILSDQTKAYEFVDNSDLADALSHVPVDGSLLVTNDTRYPADNYVRNDRQFQFAGLFGHRNYAAVLLYTPASDVAERQRLNNLLAAERWSDELDRAAARLGWTHLVVHKAAPHPGDIPLPLVYENDRYAVFRF